MNEASSYKYIFFHSEDVRLISGESISYTDCAIEKFSVL